MNRTEPQRTLLSGVWSFAHDAGTGGQIVVRLSAVVERLVETLLNYSEINAYIVQYLIIS